MRVRLCPTLSRACGIAALCAGRAAFGPEDVTSPDKPMCWVTGLDVPPQALTLVAPLGVLVLHSGERMPL
jgi:hypothetical protein